MKRGTNLKWLVWKEYRHNQLIVFLMLFLLILPYLACPVMIYISWRWKWLPEHGVPHWIFWLVAASWASLCISQPALALIGGNAIAGERVDRSAEFQAFLPIRRSKIIAGKVLLALLMAAVIWLPNALILWGTSDALMPRDRAYEALREIFGSVAIVGLTFFCVAWFFSSTISSPTFAVCAGLLTPLMVVSCILFIAYLREIPEKPIIDFWFPTLCLVLAPICFAFGTWLYLRRVEA
jgi:ABC-type transport system involved in multi-copper enzyme maturation permease subunit